MPVYAVSAMGKHKHVFLGGMIESRVDGLGWFDFLKLVTANQKKEWGCYVIWQAYIVSRRTHTNWSILHLQNVTIVINES